MESEEGKAATHECSVREVMLMSVPHGLLDDVGRLSRPDEGRRMRVPLVDVALDMPDESAHRVEGAATEGLARQDAEVLFSTSMRSRPPWETKR